MKKFVAVRVKFEKKFKNPVSLENIKKIEHLNQLPLVKQSRLSVMPIDSKSWKILNNLGNIKNKLWQKNQKKEKLNEKQRKNIDLSLNLEKLKDIKKKLRN